MTIPVKLKKLIFLLLLGIFLSGCNTGPDGYFKRSANNKLFDRKGFKGGKRAPLYNKKYITQAKKNIMSGEYDDELDDDELMEEENISRENMEMYKAMLEEEMNRDRKNKKRYSKRSRQAAYPSVVKANSRIDPSVNASNLELREELDQIKSMLNDAKREMASHKCPTAKDIEQKEQKKSEVIKPAAAEIHTKEAVKEKEIEAVKSI